MNSTAIPLPADPISAFLIKHSLLLPSHIADLLHWSDDTLKAKMARREAPPFIRVKRAVFFKADDLHDWLVAHGEVIEPSTDAADTVAADLLKTRR